MTTDNNQLTELLRTETEVILPSQAAIRINITISHGDKRPTNTEIAGIALAANSIKSVILMGIAEAKAKGLGVKQKWYERFRRKPDDNNQRKGR